MGARRGRSWCCRNLKLCSGKFDNFEFYISNYVIIFELFLKKQEALGDVVFAQLPDVGTIVTQTDECGALESVKAASELFSPISGAIVKKNTTVEDTPALINTACYTDGWLFKVKIADPAEVKALMDEKQYEEFIKSEDH